MNKAAPGPAKQAALQSLNERELRLELEARIAEAGWLKEHYDGQLREAYGRIEALEGELRRLKRQAADGQPEALPADYDRLKVECERLTAAEQRYLERIEELKGSTAR